MKSGYKVPTEAQAKKLAYLFGMPGAKVLIGENYVDPTDRVLRARGWVRRNGEVHQFSNPAYGTGYYHVITEDGLVALETYFRKRRLK